MKLDELTVDIEFYEWIGLSILVLGGDGFCGWPTAQHVCCGQGRRILGGGDLPRGLDTSIFVADIYQAYLADFH